MLNPKILKFIEDNIDYNPDTLMKNITIAFPDECNFQESECLCQAIKTTINLYKKYDQDTVSESIHQKIISEVRKSCSS